MLFCSLYAPADDTTQGSRFSSRSAVRPPHDGLRRMGRYNLTVALAAGQQQDRQTLRTPPPVVPVRTFYCRSRSVISLPAISAAGSSNRRNCGAVLAPAERPQKGSNAAVRGFRKSRGYHRYPGGFGAGVRARYQPSRVAGPSPHGRPRLRSHRLPARRRGAERVRLC